MSHGISDSVALDRDRRHALHRALADFQRDSEAVRVLDDLEGHHPAEDLDAFTHCVLPLTLGGGHLLDGKERGEDGVHAFASQSARDVGGGVADFLVGREVVGAGAGDVPEAARHGGDVDGRIAAADHDDAPRGREHPAAVEVVEEFDAGDAVLGVGAGNGQRSSPLRPDPPEDRVEVALEIVDSDVAPDPDAAADLDAVLANDAVDLRVELFARDAVAGDAEAHHAAEFFVGLEDRDRVALAPQEMRRREPGGTAADDRDALAGQRGRGWQRDPVLDRPVADILLDRIDADEVVDLVAVAAVLARGRADAAHHRGKGIGFDHAVEGVLLPGRAGHGRLVHAAGDRKPAADVVAGRATPLARRRAVHVGRALVGTVGLKDLVVRSSHSHAVLPFSKRRKVSLVGRTRRSCPSSPQDAVEAFACAASSSSACFEPVRTIAFDTIWCTLTIASLSKP